MNKKYRVLFIVGPTASGKTNLAIKLAKKMSGEVISADSMQAYRGMDVLSQMPSESDRKEVRHHLVGFKNPRSEYSAAVFSKKARKIIADVVKRGNIPIVAGGSGLYIKALIDGLFPSRGKDPVFRRKLERVAEKKGAGFLHDKLRNIDPISAEKIHPKDKRRIIRALEIYKTESRTKTSLSAATKGLGDKYELTLFGLTADREHLYTRINRRVDEMFDNGIVDEVRSLMRRKLSMTARCALGLKHVEGYLKGKYGLSHAKELLKRDTRRFAKRQLTWFRADKRIRWFDIASLSENDIVRRIPEKLWKERYLSP